MKRQNIRGSPIGLWDGTARRLPVLSTVVFWFSWQVRKPNRTCYNRPDLVARVFQLKVRELIKVLKSGIFGLYAGYVMTIEYQKLGLPHMHLLLFL
jgi:hypothetical protein